VLAVVQHEQQAAGFQVLREGLGRRAGRRVAQPDGLRDGLGDQAGLGERGQVGEPHPVGEGPLHLGGDPQHRTGLADAADAGDRDQPGGGEQPFECGPFVLPIHKAGQFRRQVSGPDHINLARCNGRTIPGAYARKPAPSDEVNPKSYAEGLSRLNRIVEHSGRGEVVGEAGRVEVEPAGDPRDVLAGHRPG
jgi:hypothetical protein